MIFQNNIKQSIKDICINIGLLIGALIFVFLLLELVFQLIPPLRQSPGYIYKNDVGRVYQPYYYGYFKNRDVSLPVAINSQGFNDAEHAIIKPKDVFRIVVVGDSFTAALHVPRNDLYTSLLEKKIANSGKKAEIINLGVDGTGTIYQANMIEKLGLQYQPDMILVQMFLGNDIADNYNESQIKDLNNKPRQIKSGIASRIKQFVFEKSRLYQFIVEKIHRIKNIEIPLVRLGLLSAPADLTKSGISFLYLLYADDSFLKNYDLTSWEKYQQGWEETAKSLAKIQKIGEEKKIPVVVVAFPDRPDVYQKTMQNQFLSVYSKMKDVKWNFEAVHKKLKVLAQLAGIKYYIDPIEQLKTIENSGNEALYYQFDGHFNIYGNAVMADIIYENIKGLIK